MMGDAPKINMSSLKKIIVKMKKNCNYILATRIKKNTSHGVLKFKGKKIIRIVEHKFLRSLKKIIQFVILVYLQLKMKILNL